MPSRPIFARIAVAAAKAAESSAHTSQLCDSGMRTSEVATMSPGIPGIATPGLTSVRALGTSGIPSSSLIDPDHREVKHYVRQKLSDHDAKARPKGRHPESHGRGANQAHIQELGGTELHKETPPRSNDFSHAKG